MSKAKAKPLTAKKDPSQFRFGIGEWYGRSFVHLTPEARVHFADLQFDRGPRPECPFVGKPCWKTGGMCSMRSYERVRATGEVKVNHRGSTFRTCCPTRFEEEGIIWG